MPGKMMMKIALTTFKKVREISFATVKTTFIDRRTPTVPQNRSCPTVTLCPTRIIEHSKPFSTGNIKEEPTIVRDSWE